MEGYKIYKRIKQDPIEGYAAEIVTFDGKNYLVVPVIMMVEGVHNGSHGPLLHSIAELGKFPESWNGIPVVINHPTKDGVNVSANSPEVIEKERIGTVFNTYIKDQKKLAAQVWIDEDKVNKISKEVLDMIKAGKTLEVSLGMFTEEYQVEGDWEGEHYEAIALNHRPDHLALLPGGVGACSVEDGCGLRVNSDGTTTSVNFMQVEGTASPATYGITTTGTVNPYWWYDSWDPQKFIIINQNQEDKEMSKTECTPCIKTRVDALIANGRFTEDDREMLQTLNEALLDKIAKPIEVEKVVERTVEVNALSEEDKTLLATYKAELKGKRDDMIKKIQDNMGKDKWPTETLEGFKDEVLVNLVGLVPGKPAEEIVDYSFNGASHLSVTDCKEEPMAPTGIKFKN